MILAAVAVVVRVSIALATQTFFQPDEYFQSLEVAHRLVYGYGHLTWEWLSPKPIRSILYPALNIPVYWILNVLGLDETLLLVGACTQIRRAYASYSPEPTDMGAQDPAWSFGFLDRYLDMHADEKSRG